MNKIQERECSRLASEGDQSESKETEEQGPLQKKGVSKEGTVDR